MLDLIDRERTTVITFGEHEGCDWQLVLGDTGWLARTPDGERYTLPLRVPGIHHARNALAALAVLVGLGHDPAAAAAALATYTGIGRRFEVKGEANGVLVIDDYAHHPREIAANIAAARARYPKRRLVVAFQPHTYSRTHALLDDFAVALRDADVVAVLDIYAARETDTLGVSAADLVARVPGAVAAGDVREAATRLAALVQQSDLVLTFGAGTVTSLGPLLLELLATESVTSRIDRGDERNTPNASVRPRRAERSAPEKVPGADGLRVQRDAPMSLYTTWRIGGPADALIRASSPDQLIAAVRWGTRTRAAGDGDRWRQ